MRLGIVGAGMIVKNLLPCSMQMAAITHVAICATLEELPILHKLQTIYNINTIYTDYQVFLADKMIDTIYIGIPNHLHYQFTLEALRAGKHVICEKPFTSNTRELAELIACAKSNNLFLFEAITNQYLPNYLAIKEKVKELGVVKIIECNYSQYSSRYDAFKKGNILPAFDHNKSGGALMDLNIYNIHFVVGLFGPPMDVHYYANIEHDIDTSGVLVMDYGNFKAVCIGSKDSQAPIGCNIQGDEAFIHVNGSASNCDSFDFGYNRKEAVTVDLNIHPHRMYDEFVAFVEMLQTKNYERMEKMLLHSKNVMDIVEKAKLSANLKFLADL